VEIVHSHQGRVGGDSQCIHVNNLVQMEEHSLPLSSVFEIDALPRASAGIRYLALADRYVRTRSPVSASCVCCAGKYQSVIVLCIVSAPAHFAGGNSIKFHSPMDLQGSAFYLLPEIPFCLALAFSCDTKFCFHFGWFGAFI